MKAKLLFLTVLIPGISMAMNSKDSVNYAKRDIFLLEFELGVPSVYNQAANMGLSLKLKKTYYKLKIGSAYTSDNEFQNIGCSNCEVQSSGVTEVVGVVGKSYAISKRLQFQFGAGPALVIKTSKDDLYNATRPVYLPEKYREKYTAGVSSEIRARYFFKDYLAASCTLQGNGNPLQSYSAITFGIGFSMF